MPMIDLKRSPQPEKDEPAEPLYPWGLCIYLDNETLEKMKMDQGDFKVGSEFPLTVQVRVTGVSARETEEGTRESVDLQIVAIEKPLFEEGRAERLFGRGG